jgi:hypothetical protein
MVCTYVRPSCVHWVDNEKLCIFSFSHFCGTGALDVDKQFVAYTRQNVEICCEVILCLYGEIRMTLTLEFEVASILFYLIHSSMSVQPIKGPGVFFSFVIFFTQTVELLGRVISPSQGRCLHAEQHKHNKRTRRHPCLEWDSNPRHQLPSERTQFIP